MAERNVVCVMKRVSQPGELWSDEDVATRPASEWRVCLKYVAPMGAFSKHHYKMIGYEIPIEEE